MLEKLKYFEVQLPKLLTSLEWSSVYIDYNKPYVERIWVQIGADRVYLHKIYPCLSNEALIHPHPWRSAIKIISGKYEMGMGYSESPHMIPNITTKLLLVEGSYYEMNSPFDWHYVRPIDEPSYSIMISGKPFNPGSKSERPELKVLSSKNKSELLEYFKSRYPIVNPTM